MDQWAEDVLPVAEYLVIASYVLLAMVALLQVARGGRAARWGAAAFGALGFAILAGQVLDATGVEESQLLSDVLTGLIVAFPYLLFRFTASLRPFPRWLEAVALLAVVGAVASIFALPTVEEGEPEPGWYLWWITAILVYWGGLSFVTVASLWRAGRGQPTVARRRMRLMAAGAAGLAIALIIAGEAGSGASTTFELVVQVVALFSALAFGLGFAPPRALRLSWRRPEEEALQQGTMSVLRATTADDVATALLPPTVGIVGASAAAVVDRSGAIIARHGVVPDDLNGPLDVDTPAREVIPLPDPFGWLVVWTSRFTPFFGREEVELLTAMGAVVGLALERIELLERERRDRVELAAARDEAERANAAKSEFLSRMSHELRTPMNVILGFAQLLDGGRLSPEDQEWVQHILKAGRHLLALINDVLDLSRVEAGGLAVSLEPVHTGELIGDTLDLIRPLAAQRGIRILTDLVACDTHVTTDRRRCTQVLLNLLSNAVKYNFDGGEVRVSCGPSEGQRLRVVVRDTGPGISEGNLDKLFDPFERLGADATRVEGTGLGLALSRQLAKVMGADLGVESTVGEGSTFWLDLPLTEGPSASEAPLEETFAPTTSTEPRKVLLIEDNLANVRVVEAVLARRPGYEVLAAMQGVIGMDLAREHQPDLILLDLHLPDVPGDQLLPRLRSDPRTRDIPVVIISADATDGRIERVLAGGAFAYVTKPLEISRFLAVIDEALASRRATTGTSTPDE